MAADEFSSGMSKFRVTVKGLETIAQIFKAMIDQMKEDAHFQRFLEGLKEFTGQKNPKNIELNTEIAGIYNTQGLGAMKMRKLLDEHNIPNAIFTDKKTGLTTIAVPKQFEKQANMLFNLETVVGTRESVNGDEAKLVNRVTEHSKIGDTIAKATASSVLSNKSVFYEFKNANFANYIAQQCKTEGIIGVSTATKDGKTYLIVPKEYEQKLDQMIVQGQRTRSELTANEFAKACLGKQIIEHKDLTLGQVYALRSSLRGACVQYTVQQQQNGGYTFRYNAERANIVEPALIGAQLRTVGVSGKQVEAQSRAVEMAIENAKDYANSGYGVAVVDASKGVQDPEAGFIIDNSGIKSLDGKTLLVSKSDPNFEAEVHARVSECKAPVVKSFDVEKKPDIPNLYTLDEINRAREGAALANPELCTVLASQIITGSMEGAAQAGNASMASYVQAGINSAYRLANAIEEDGERRGFDELKDDTRLPEGYHDTIDELKQAIDEMTPEERKAFAQDLRDAADATQEKMSRGEMDSRNLGQEDMSLEDIGVALDGRDAPETDAPELGSDTPNVGTPEVAVDDIM